MQLTFWASFIGGVLTFFSPCVLPLVPVYMSFVTGLSVEELKAAKGFKSLTKIALSILSFILGFTLVFVSLGASASLIGGLLFNYRQVLIRLAGLIIIVFGLYLIGIFQIPFLSSERRINLNIPQTSRVFFAFILGITFGFAWSPCAGPLLGSILLLASTSASVLKGVYYLFAYSLGLAIPLFLVGLAFSSFIKLYSRSKSLLGILNKVAGILLILFGILMTIGKLSILYNVLGV